MPEYTKGCGYHRAWGRAKDSPNYDKKAWIHCQGECEGEFAIFKRRIAELEREIVRADERLIEVGICPSCGQEFRYYPDKSIAVCTCGSSKWTKDPPDLQMLRRQLKEAHDDLLGSGGPDLESE